ncbi:hypothetical protein BS78_09G079600 [Paspalum vaginatum]|nr:hypothetical protein BS78_09G079600 [Paspalum vaginatum]
MLVDTTTISQLQPGKLTYAIHVRISRMWEFRGPNEQNDIKHLDLVLIDQKGDSIYAEIPLEAISNVKEHLEEHKIVYIFKITIDRAKPGYRVVDNPYMLHQYTKKTDRFLDVIGRIRAVSNAAKVYTTLGDPIMRRVILLEDLKGNTIKLSLSGKRALEFDGERVLSVGQDHHVIAIFVGTLMKLYRDEYKFLSGTSACRWYINENDIAEIKAFQKKYKLPFIASDDTYSLEFVFFEKKSQELIGKSTMTLRKEYEPKKIPSDISAWIGYKFTFVVKVLSTKSVNADNPSFEVVMIKEKLGKQPLISAINTSILPISSTAALTEYKDLPLLVPISSRRPKNRFIHPSIIYISAFYHSSHCS